MQQAIMVIIAILLPLVTMAQEWTEHPVATHYYQADCVYAADVDGDGDTDILGVAYQAGDITWWENSVGDGLIWIEHTIDGEFPGANSVYATDVDGDGDLDVLGTAWSFGEFTWWENVDGNGLSWVEHPIAELLGPNCVYAADVDGDGDEDVLSAAQADDDITWWENLNGSGLVWVEHTVDEFVDGASSVYATDMDADGDIDIVGAAYVGDYVAWWENVDGGGLTWAEHLVGGNFDFTLSVYAADVDGDGDTDVLGASRADNDITWWENLYGDGHFWTEHIVDEEFYSAENVYATDVDGDGDIDVLGAGGGAITWWDNADGSGLHWIENTLNGNFGEAYSVYATDIDGDADIDIIGAARGANLITWWEQPTPYPLRVTSPNGGEVWRTNTTRNIQWISGAQEDVYIELLDGPFVEGIISEGAENNGSFQWTIPQNLDLGNDYRIRLTLLSGEEQDVSDEAFAIGMLPTLTMSPHNPPITISANGNGFWYWVEIYNQSSSPGTGEYWTEVVLPSGYIYGPIDFSTLTLGPWETFAPNEPFAQWVPAYAPAGIYEFVMHLGLFPNAIIATDSFEFEKLAGANATTLPESAWSIDDWKNEAWELAGVPTADDVVPPLPTDYAVSPAHPNPFNAATTISVTLPDAAVLNVSIYNVNGRQVAQLANGQFNAGKHTLTFDGSNLASGLYFVRASAPGELNEMRKIVLMK
jgi:Secretion system C-terminal sorting domain/FG-GAP-like repeat